MAGLTDTDLVALFYEASADEAGWPGAVQALIARFGACSGLFYTESRHGLGLLQTPEWSDEALRLYAERYHALDPYARVGGTSRTSWVMLGHEMVDQKAFLESEMWHDFGRTHCNGALHVMCATAQLGDASGLRLGLHRAKDNQDFSDQDRTQLGLLLPHLARSLQLRERFQQGRHTAALSLAALDGIAMGVTVMDGDGRAVLANTAAMSLRIDGRSILGAAQSGFAIRSVTQSRQLAELVANVATGGAGGTLRVRRQSGPDVLLFVSRLPQTMVDGLGRSAGGRHLALVLSRDLAAGGIGTAELRSMFGLTEAEADLATGLAQGQTAAVLAARRGRSVLTVRGQIRAILEKTSAGNLRELTLLLATCQP